MDGMESRWYLAPGQTLENTNISDLQHALHVTRPAWHKINAHLDRNRIIAETLEKERAYKQAMKEGSEAMTKNWPDSIEVRVYFKIIHWDVLLPELTEEVIHLIQIGPISFYLTRSESA